MIHCEQGTTASSGSSDHKRFYQFSGNVLRLGGPPTINEAGALVYGHLYWERLAAGQK